MRTDTFDTALPARDTSLLAGEVGSRWLTTRYAFALLITATALLAMQLLSGQQLRGSVDGVQIVNTSGEQRMLSQRIALLASEAVRQDDPVLREAAAQPLRTAIERMAGNHEALVADWTRRAELGDAWLGALFADDQLALLVDSLLINARSVTDSLNEEASATERLIGRNTALTLLEVARGDLLGRLDAVVLHYVDRQRSQLDRLYRFGWAWVCAGLLVLLLQALLVFRPMVRRIVATIEALRQSRDEQIELGRRMSHDLRAPIASSLGVAGILADALEEHAVEEAREATGRLRGALQHLDLMLARLMVVTRLHGAVASVQPVELDALMRDVLGSLCEESACGPAIDCRLEVDRPILADPDLLHDIARILVRNALVFGRGCATRITVHGWTRHSVFHLRVDDDGAGIPEPCRARVFQMFQRFHPDRADGVGLGLYRATLSTRLMGGQLTYHPLPTGSRFELTVPQRRTLGA